MRPVALLLALTLIGSPVGADSLVATNTLKPRSIVNAEDVKLVDADLPNAFRNVADVVGLEVRRAVYAGRAITFDDLGAPTLVERNQMVRLIFETGGLVIATDGRALERGGFGDYVRVINRNSRTTVSGEVQQDGSVHVFSN
ncbi:MAG: flagellar basal body P-ring formation chaperone FlgA [Octadecabacter sp.]